MSPSRDGGHDGELVAIAQRRREAAAEPNVLVVEVEGHEWVRVTGIVAQPRRERWKARGHLGDGIADGLAFGFDDAAIRELREHGWQMQSDGHTVAAPRSRYA